MTTRSDTGGSAAAPAALAFALAFYAWLAWSFRGYTPDDSYIFFRYAQNFADGRGLVFNPGERVQGFTSALWTLLLAAAAWAGLPLVAFAKVCGALLGGGCIVIAQAIARRISPRAAIAAPIVLAGFLDLPYWSIAGMDAPLFAFTVALALLLTARAADGGSPAAAALAWGVCGITRPEGAALGAVAIVWMLRSRGGSGRAAMTSAAMFALPIVAWTAFAWTYYGDPLPNTYWAKRFDRIESFRRGLVFLRAFVSANDGAFMAAAIAGALWLVRARVLGLVFWILALYFAFLLWTGGDSWVAPNAFRFAMPMLVPLAVAMAAGLAAIWDRLVATGAPRAASLAAAATCVLWLAFPSTSGHITTRVGGDSAIIAHLQAHSRPGDALAVTDIGNFAYRTDLPVIDTFGLVDRWVATSLRKRTNSEYAAGEAERLTSYLMERAPRWIILKGSMRNGAVEIQNETGAPVIYGDPRFQREYGLAVAGVDEPYLLFERRAR